MHFPDMSHRVQLLCSDVRRAFCDLRKSMDELVEASNLNQDISSEDIASQEDIEVKDDQGQDHELEERAV